MASEAGHFNIDDAIEAICSKLIRRHPHVFGDGDAKTSDEVLKKWDEIKATEKVRPKGLLTGIPRALPALVEGDKLARKAAGAGFDWPGIEPVFDKLREELDELDGARKTGSQEDIEGEVGDLLFVVVNIARFLKVDPEQALRKTNTKFRRRFAHVEDGLGKPLKDATIEEMEALWQAAKHQEKTLE
jgi:MazG family protein